MGVGRSTAGGAGRWVLEGRRALDRRTVERWRGGHPAFQRWTVGRGGERWGSATEGVVRSGSAAEGHRRHPTQQRWPAAPCDGLLPRGDHVISSVGRWTGRWRCPRSVAGRWRWRGWASGRRGVFWRGVRGQGGAAGGVVVGEVPSSSSLRGFHTGTHPINSGTPFSPPISCCERRRASPSAPPCSPASGEHSRTAQYCTAPPYRPPRRRQC